MSFVGSNILAGASGQGGSSYEIERSLRFNSADSAYLSRTPASAGNRKKWTWAGWVKRSALASGGTQSQVLFGGPASQNYALLFFSTTNTLVFENHNNGLIVADGVFRDTSAWYHIVLSVDTTNATSDDRMVLYVNGVRQTTTTYNPPGLNSDTYLNQALEHRIGRFGYNNYEHFLSGYLADVHFVDGQALDPTSFGEFDNNNVWQPKKYGDTTTTYTSSAITDVGSSISTTVSASASNVHGGSAANIIDGNTSTVCNAGTVTITFNPAISGVIEVYAGMNSGLSGQWNISGGGFTNYSFNNGTSSQWHTLQTLNNVSSITIGAQGYSNQQGSEVKAFKLNGTLITASSFSTNNIALTTTDNTNLSDFPAGGDVGSGVSVVKSYPSNNALVVDGGTWTTGDYVSVSTDAFGTNGFHLDFSDNSSASALGTDSSDNNNTWTVNNITAVSAFSTPVSAAWTGYTGSNWLTTDTWDSLSDTTTNFGNNSGTKGYSTITETWTGTKTSWTGAFGASNRGSNGWALKFPSSVTITVNPVATSSIIACASTSTAVSAGTSYTSFPATMTGQVFWFNCSGYPSVGIYNSVAIPANAYTDSLIDTPTNYKAASGNNGGNYATWNPLKLGALYTLSNGNLDVSGSGPNLGAVATIGFSGGKWYWEIIQTSGVSANSLTLGITTNTSSPTDGYAGNTATSGWSWRSSGPILTQSANITANTGVTYTDGDVLQIAFDADAGKVWLGKNGTWIASGNPATGTNQTLTYSVSEAPYFPTTRPMSGASKANFGQRPFAYTLPAGYKSLCTTNLPDPTIADGSTAMDVALYTGDGTSDRAITGLGMSPDFVWIKSRSGTTSHVLLDAVRGTDKILASDSTLAESTTDSTWQALYGNLDSFDSAGFTVTNGTDSAGNFNSNNVTYAAWTWDAGSSNTSISAGGLNGSVYALGRTWSSDLSATSLANQSKMFDWTYSYGSYTGTCTWTTTDAAYSSLSGRVYLANNTTVTLGITFKDSGNNVLGSFSLLWTGDGTQMQDTGFDWSSSVASVEITGDYLPVRVQIGNQTLVDNGTTVPNVPSIASTVRANPSVGFSIVTFNSGSAGQKTVGHGLNAAPAFVISKTRDQAGTNWTVYHESLGKDNFVNLNSTGAASSSSSIWGISSPTSSVIGLNSGTTTGASGDCVFYCFAPVDGYSDFGTYVGNGSTDGPFVYTGFRPKFLLTKSSSGATNWHIVDSERGTSNVIGPYLTPNATDAELNYGGWDLLSNGFKLRNVGNTINSSGATYIYAAFAENPFKTARAR